MKFHCDHCKAVLSITKEVYGSFVQCPKCQKTLKAPFPEVADLVCDEEAQIKESRPAGWSTAAYLLAGLSLAVTLFTIFTVTGKDDDKGALGMTKNESPQFVARQMRSAYASAERTLERCAIALPIADIGSAGTMTDREALEAIGHACANALPNLEKVDVRSCPPEFADLFNSFRALVRRISANPTYFVKLVSHPFMPVAAARYGTCPEWEQSVHGNKKKIREDMIARGQYPLP